MYVREITATYGSHAYFYAPNWKEEYSKRVITGTDGDDGKHGIDGTEGLWKHTRCCFSEMMVLVQKKKILLKTSPTK